MANATLTEFLAVWWKARKMAIPSAVPARVLTYDKEKQLVDVQPVVGTLWVDRFSKTERARALPRIEAVPVIHPGGGGMKVFLPVAPGDYVMLIISTYQFSDWFKDGIEHADGKADGGRTQPDPNTHILSECVAIPGLFSTPTTGVDADDEDLVLGQDDADNQIIIEKDGSVVLGKGATSFAAKADEVETRLQDLYNAIATAAPVPGDGGAAIKAAVAALSWAPVPSVAADLVKVK